ncbi:MAG: tRNA lysidine(34) synthetase TilS [Alphaproteobacteria bacterium]
MAPVSGAEFASLMERMSPFESGVVIAVGVSGGVDSLALCLLMDFWARERNGSVVALTVDHGLRPQARQEALRVADWLGSRGIAHHVLTHQGPAPVAGLQAAARTVRYGLLTQWCREHGVLHLAVAHNLEDQAETLLLRLGRGSGLTGLAAMAPVVSLADVRLLRPLLSVRRHRLEATVRTFGQTWIEDPSNQNPIFQRVRIRSKLLPVLADEGVTVERLAEATRHLGRARAALERAVAETLARAVTLDSAGFAILNREALGETAEEIGLRALAAVITCIGGQPYPPRMERLERLYRALTTPSISATLGGCRILAKAGAPALVCREAGRIAGMLPLQPGQRQWWDARFLVTSGPSMEPGLHLAALGEAGYRQVTPDRSRRPPMSACLSLPAIFETETVLAVPHLGYVREGAEKRAGGCRVVFAPRRPLTTP